MTLMLSNCISFGCGFEMSFYICLQDWKTKSKAVSQNIAYMKQITLIIYLE